MIFLRPGVPPAIGRAVQEVGKEFVVGDRRRLCDACRSDYLAGRSQEQTVSGDTRANRTSAEAVNQSSGDSANDHRSYDAEHYGGRQARKQAFSADHERAGEYRQASDHGSSVGEGCCHHVDWFKRPILQLDRQFV